MSLNSVTFQAARPTFRANNPGGTSPNVVPQNIPLADLQTAQPQYLKPFKPGLIARVRAFFTNLAETTKGAVAGMFYGAAAGVPAAAVGAFMVKGGAAVKATKLGKFVLAAGALGGLLTGALVGKKTASESIKGAGVGVLYGAAAGAAASLTAIALKSKGAGPVAKGALIAATVINTIIGAWVGKLVANGKVGKIYDQHGRSRWSAGG